MHRLFALPALLLLATLAHADEQTRAVPAFSAINSKGPISVLIEAGKTQSVVVSGNTKFVSEVITEVVGDELRISMKDKNSKSASGDPKVTITLPALRQLKIEGAGVTALNNISGDRLDVSYQGAGSLKANGKVKWLRLKAQGVGEVDTKALNADRVDVEFEGIGTVKVFANELLNAVVQGMGTLTYYGNPRTVNKSVQGIGSVSSGS
ncbi:GIN domain-containing protein [Undibacterium terreum]|uniref:Putative auto-transporter adhesin head GIN domain-containing protein n=1 Tax=Undibacterium terreum TaxID=1224302 RepID=A0A916XPK9_9BURK|nr:DUF2807 domain-containing protein [Undibacterium terreum]GGC89755.1 hypothetical protein GCM10011396_41240 [Undibacterium terreum]